MESFEPTDRTRVRRVSERAVYDRKTVFAILDEALIAHVGFVADGFVADGFVADDFVAGGAPVVLPMAFVRVGSSIFLHGSTRARMLEAIAAGAPVCVTTTLVDGLVLARSAFHHSMNYRSVAVHGRGRAVESRERALGVLEALTEKLTPGRWPAVRQPTEREMRATLVVEIPIEQASAKVRSGPPVDDREDLGLGIWAGTVPILSHYADPVADPQLPGEVAVPDHVRRLSEC